MRGQATSGWNQRVEYARNERPSRPARSMRNVTRFFFESICHALAFSAYMDDLTLPQVDRSIRFLSCKDTLAHLAEANPAICGHLIR